MLTGSMSGSSVTDLPDLSAAQAAARLGIKPESLYAYVSRGLLRRHKGAGGSRFDALEIEAFVFAEVAGVPDVFAVHRHFADIVDQGSLL